VQRVTATPGHTHTHTHARAVGQPWMRSWLFTETSAWQHSQGTDIHAQGEIRTCSPSKRAASDPRLRPHSHRDGRQSLLPQLFLPGFFSIHALIITILQKMSYIY